jgi:hypothetical protein
MLSSRWSRMGHLVDALSTGTSVGVRGRGTRDAPWSIQVEVTGAGQVMGCYAYASAGGDVTLGAVPGAPAELPAVLAAE